MLSAADHSRHSRNKTNNLDPDDGNSWLCSACKLPIFATPFTGGGGVAALLHDQCANLPEVLNDCELHPEKSLLLGDHNNNNQQTCSECSQICGTKLYYCPDSDCGLVLDVACALPIKILHRSHEHRLVAIRSDARSSGATCGVCGAAHHEAAAAAAAVVELRSRSYSCNVCGFWIHPECAALANVIEHEKHEHPLVLYYDVHATFGADDSTPAQLVYFGSTAPFQNYNERHICAICGNEVARRRGIYSCIMCRDYVIHVKCATSHPRTFKPVSIGEARFPRLVRFPLKDEHQSFVSSMKGSLRPHIKEFHGCQLHGIYDTFTLHDHDVDADADADADDDDDQDSRFGRRLRVCDVCVKIINTPPFYSCSMCPNFFLHEDCSHLSIVLSGGSIHIRGHQFFIALYDDNDEPICDHCRCRFIQSGSYHCNYGGCSFDLDISCAIMPIVITHDAHNATHFLRLTDAANSSSSGRVCDCCARQLGNLSYECRTCPNFALHTWCAMLPRTVTHKFDPHPLTLTTATTSSNNGGVDTEMMICEICEHGIESGVWCYSCSECDQLFHVDCIPCLELTYKIKSLADSGHPYHVPTRLIRGLTLEGHGHDYCADVADEYDILASY